MQLQQRISFHVVHAIVGYLHSRTSAMRQPGRFILDDGIWWTCCERGTSSYVMSVLLASSADVAIRGQLCSLSSTWSVTCGGADGTTPAHGLHGVDMSRLHVPLLSLHTLYVFLMSQIQTRNALIVSRHSEEYIMC